MTKIHIGYQSNRLAIELSGIQANDWGIGQEMYEIDCVRFPKPSRAANKGPFTFRVGGGGGVGGGVGGDLGNFFTRDLLFLFCFND